MLIWSEPDSHGPPPVHSRTLKFLILYALAWGGGVIAYVPLLTLVLPVKIEALAPGDKVALLSLTTLLGAIVASVVNIAVGMASDRGVSGPRGRRPWVAAGLALTLGSYGLVHLSTTSVTIVLAVMAFQAALNLMLAPLSALVADEVPDHQKGLIGGLMGAVYTFGALSGIVVTASPRLDEAAQLGIIGGLVTAAMMPFLLVSRRRGPIVPVPALTPAAGGLRRDALVRVWIARLLVQIAGSILFAYLLFFFQTVDRTGLLFGPPELSGQVAWLAGSVTVLLVPLAIAAGRLSDAVRSRKPFLVGSAAMITSGLLVMALLPQWAPAAAGYVVFACGVAIFLALQGAYAMQLLMSPRHRGRDMGILNLTNTLPALIAPSLAWLMADKGDFTALLLLLAALAALALILLIGIRDQPTPAAC
ncbi:MFS transporter [Brevundimonas sp. R86498]|uniref:MFS transporter n=1 Tax=Brevundimonas sp. R86498 TaxID=3093845 RepID=UPI0037C6584D